MDRRILYIAILTFCAILIGTLILLNNPDDTPKSDDDEDSHHDLIFETTHKKDNGFSIILKNYNHEVSLDDMYIFIQTDFITDLHAEQLFNENISLSSLQNNYIKDYMVYIFDNDTISNTFNVSSLVSFFDVDDNHFFSEGDIINIKTFDEDDNIIEVDGFHVFFIENNERIIFHDIIVLNDDSIDNPYHIND